ncbi:hypothetical protein H0H92_006120 [Tricholoma furcatifolium]|nr:hypothetical protein H0H92_006120 [Tricholoma furcatifolium]
MISRSSTISDTGYQIARIENGPLVLRAPPSLRTLDDVRLQVAFEVAMRAITQAKTVDGVKVGVSLSLSKREDELFLYRVADAIESHLALTSFLFAIATTGTSSSEKPNPLVVIASSAEFVQRVILLTSAKFIGRIRSGAQLSPVRWAGFIDGIGSSTYDDDALWDIIIKSARAPIDPTLPPPGSRSIDQILSDARAKLERLTPQKACEELWDPKVDAPTFLVDIRPVSQRDLGGIQGSLVIERNELEWKFDPRNQSKLAIADRMAMRQGKRFSCTLEKGRKMIIVAISLAAHSLQQLGLLNATDIIGGYQAWKDAGLPVDDKARTRALLE